MSNAIEQVAKARAGLVLDNAFFGSLALRLAVKEATEAITDTMATNGVDLYIHPKFVEACTTKQLKGVIAHEIMHCALQHHTRRGNRDPEKWNFAADYAINPLVLDAGFEYPSFVQPLVSDDFRNKSAEEIYRLLPEGQPQGGGPGDGDGSGKSSQGSSFGDVMDAPGKDGGPPSNSDLRESAQSWKVALAQAATQAKKAGQLPGGIERLIEDILEPKLDWREILKRFVDTVAKNDYSWTRPNRRHIGEGLYLPSLRSHRLGQVVAAVDTSGSITQKQLNEFAAELNFILGEYNADCTVIYCDTRVAHVDHFEAGDPLTMKVYGGGGTDFAPPFEYVDEHGIDPVCFLYFTDGWCNSYSDPPAFPTLWVQTDSHHHQFEPPFGEVLELS